MAGLMDMLLGAQGQTPPQKDQFGIDIVPGLMGGAPIGTPPPQASPQQQHMGGMMGAPPMDLNQLQMLLQMLGAGRQ